MNSSSSNDGVTKAAQEYLELCRAAASVYNHQPSAFAAAARQRDFQAASASISAQTSRPTENR